MIFMKDDIEKLVSKLVDKVCAPEEGSCIDATILPLHGCLPLELQANALIILTSTDELSSIKNQLLQGYSPMIHIHQDLHYLWRHQDHVLILLRLSSQILMRGKVGVVNMPRYDPIAKEAKQLIEAEGSFTLQKLETFKSRNRWKK
ncbi:putative pre-mRNA-splicing factor ATP-dependent RNA helicase DEAH4 [Glycine max]|nr:putative pre-mRNA-splicing factor ATP-dependent RNA helicase DEAH4 [Glycine max]